MPRPAILVVEVEPVQALSARKLILETAKFNVLTAHSTEEAFDLIHLFPNISMAVFALDEHIDSSLAAQAMRKSNPKIPIVCLTPNINATCDFADYTVSSFDPESLLQLARSLLGDPRANP